MYFRSSHVGVFGLRRIFERYMNCLGVYVLAMVLRYAACGSNVAS